MPLDTICISALADELQCLVGSKIDKVQQPERDIIILQLRGAGHNDRLLISAGSGTARVHLCTESYENPSQPPMFCMLLRKHIVGARITGVFQPDYERMLVFELDTFDEMGVEIKKKLIVELMGRNANIILAGAEGHIIECLRRVDSDLEAYRQLQPGMFYLMPPKQGRPNFLTVPYTEIATMWNDASADTLTDKWVLNSFFGLSPLISREISYISTGDVSKPKLALSDSESKKFLEELARLKDTVQNAVYTPTMLVEKDEPKDFSFMPIKQYENSLMQVGFPSFSALLESYYTRREKAESIRRKSQSLYKNVRSAHERAVRKLAARREELLKTENRDLARKRGDLITANLYRMKKGDRVLETEDYYEEECPRISIPLDPLKTPQQNAAAYYKEYNKAKTAICYLGDLIEKGEQEEQYLLSVLDEITRTESEQNLTEIRRELTETGFIRQQKTNKKERIKQSEPMRFVSSSGMEISVGKNNSQNDILTTQLARRTDLWLHVQKLHGSHVIISCNDAEPDERSIFEAATLAAYYSQARDSGKVPVDYTQVRFVKKPSGSMPGAVIYTDYKTILVEPDEKLCKKLEK